ncbi:MAG: hypothetical protein AAGD25_08905 [Cyanobacteria bacterium P01_F01_bin.150]
MTATAAGEGETPRRSLVVGRLAVDLTCPLHSFITPDLPRFPLLIP